MRLQHTKDSENEADNYAFETLTQLNYYPLALGIAFEKLEKDMHYAKKGTFVRDYFKSHPSADIRTENWLEVGRRYIKKHSETEKILPKKEPWAMLKKLLPS